MELAFKDLHEAWAPVMNLNFEYINREVNPQFANIVSPTEVVVCNKFHVELEGGGGDFYVVMPYSMLEPIRELLDAGVQSDRSERDERWTLALREEVKSADVQVNVTLAEATLRLGDLLNLREGDVIPIQYPDKVVPLTGGFRDVADALHLQRAPARKSLRRQPGDHVRLVAEACRR